MLIVPIEKQFDWQRAPFVLIAIVIINVAVFVFYQSKDGLKAMSALEPFVETGMAEREWPIYEGWLEKQHEPEELAQARKLVLDEEYYGLAYGMLLDRAYFDYVIGAAEREFDSDDYLVWKDLRIDIQNRFNSTSALAYGLRATEVRWETLISYQFLHGSIGHILGNMVFLVIFGFAVEAAIGHLRFLLFYLIGGIGAALAQVLTDPGSDIPLIGASGAISAVMAMYLVVFRLRKIEFFYWILFFVGYFRAPALLILPFYFGKEIFSYLTQVDSNVAFMAHAGGIVTGAVLMGLMLLFDRNLLDHDYIEQDQKISPRHKALAAIYDAIEAMRFDYALKKAAALMAKEGVDFELALLRFNLEKIKKGKNYIPCFRALMTLPDLTDDALGKVHELWLETDQALVLLPKDEQLRLAFQFTRLQDLRGAEQIMDQLHAAKFKPSELTLLAARLAKRFADEREHDKNRKYQQLAQTLTREGQHGFM